MQISMARATGTLELVTRAGETTLVVFGPLIERPWMRVGVIPRKSGGFFVYETLSQTRAILFNPKTKK